jgi:hypothetical protein
MAARHPPCRALNGRRETIYLGKYGPEGLSLAPAFLHMARSARERAWPLGNFAISALKPNNMAAAKGAQILLFMFSVPSRDDSLPYRPGIEPNPHLRQLLMDKRK